MEEFKHLNLEWKPHGEPDTTISVIELVYEIGRGGDLGDILKARGAIRAQSTASTPTDRLEGWHLQHGFWHEMKAFQNSICERLIHEKDTMDRGTELHLSGISGGPTNALLDPDHHYNQVRDQLTLSCEARTIDMLMDWFKIVIPEKYSGKPVTEASQVCSDD